MFQRFVFSEPNYNASGTALNKFAVAVDGAVGFFGSFIIDRIAEYSNYGIPRTGIETKPVSISVAAFITY